MKFRTALPGVIITVFLFAGSLHSSLNAQYENKSTSDLKSEAIKNFDSGNYSDALVQYKSLLTRYPKDGNFSYYCGRCLLNLDKDIPASIGYLEYASSKPMVPYQVFYFLGDAYTRNFQFSQAKKAYSQFTDVASKSELKELMPARLAEMSANAAGQTTSYNDIDIIASSLFSFSDSNYVSQVHAPGGSLYVKPAELIPSADGIKDIANLMFIPRNLEKGQFLFYAGYGKSKKRGTDIFMVKAGNGKKFSDPVPVDALNSDYDEILPYYDPIGKDLIFASKGHNSMGGFDLFKSHYDVERNTWTPPMNLGFPVNSPSDEYLMIPGTDMGTIMLISNRQGQDSMITAYMLRIHEPRKQMAKADPAELKRISRFGGIDAVPENKGMTIRDILNETQPQLKPEPQVQTQPEPQAQIPDKKTSPVMPIEYNQFLRLALDQQFKADSLARLAREARIQVTGISDAAERWEIQKNIISWEKDSADFQAKADDYYMKVRQMENGKNPTKPVPAAITKDTVINDITVYKYKPVQPEKVDTTPAKAVIEKENPLVGEPGDAVKPVTNSENVMNRFVLLDKSPYSVKNPFPEDSMLPKGCYYKIQLAVLGKDPDWNAFGGLSPVTYETVPGKALKKFYAGKFVNYESAKTALEEVRKRNFPEAFIVGWYDGQKLTVGKVVEMEK